MTTLGHVLVGRQTPEQAALEAATRRHRSRKRRGITALIVLLLAGGAVLISVLTSGGGTPSPGKKTTRPEPAGLVVDAGAFSGEGTLAFASGGALYVLDGLNGVVRQVGHITSGAEDPTFSPDGRYLAYIAAGAETSSGRGSQAPFMLTPGPLVVASADGTSPHTVQAVGPVASATWSPSADALLVVTGTPYDGNSASIVSPDGAVLKVAAGSPVYGAVWSPDGREVAVAAGHAGVTTLETFPLTGGAPTTWARLSGPQSQWVVPIGWWNDQGIGVWVGGDGTVPAGQGLLDGAEMGLVARPGAGVRFVGRTPPQALVPSASSSTGWLAVDTQAPSSFPRAPWSKKTISTCAPSSDSCTPIGEAPALTALDPAWSADGSTLAFVGAAASDSDSFFPAAVQHWYASAQLFTVKVGGTTPSPVAGSDGASAPTWSATGDSLLFVADDALYLISQPGAGAQRIAGPLLPASRWTSTYYGSIDWRFMYGWTS